MKSTTEYTLKEIDEKSKHSLPSKIEAILYLKGKPLKATEIADLLKKSEQDINSALFELMAGFAQRDTAFEINEENGSYSLQLKTGLEELVQNLLPVDLNLGPLRTLATVALKKRILQSELVDIRGSSAYEHIKELIEKDFLQKKRQKDGRSYWLTLSDKFHITFTIISTENSPEIQKAA